MAWRRATGDNYEARALRQLEAAGLSLLERNFNTRYGEIDLIMRHNEIVVFVEVRYRRNRNFGGAVLSITPRKRQRLVRAASLFLQARPQLAEQPCRFDVLAFDDHDSSTQGEWLRNAFDAF